MKRKLISLSDIKRKEAALYAQYLMNGEAVAWLYILTGDYFEFIYPGHEYPNAVLPASDSYFRVRDTTLLVRTLMRFTIDGEHGWIDPGELVDENGEIFKVRLDEIRVDEHGEASYKVDAEGNPESVRFSLAQFSLEMVNQKEQIVEDQGNQSGFDDSGIWVGLRKDNCNIVILTYLQKCDAEDQTPTPEKCWEFTKEDAVEYGENWVIFRKIRFPEQETKKVHRENFNRRYAKLLAAYSIHK